MAIDYNPSNCVISVGVSDYDRSLAWYRDVLGFEIEYELAEYGWCELRTPFSFNIGLGNRDGREGNGSSVHDIDPPLSTSTIPTAHRGCSRRRSTSRRRVVE